jgi:malonyl CoA-acyl carrier protein transacylase
MKSVEYRIQWQRAVEELEKAYTREKELTLQVQQVKELLANTQDELKTTRKNYEEKIKLLSMKLASLKENRKDEKSFIESLFTREKTT